jgi:hypothetical protein
MSLIPQFHSVSAQADHGQSRDAPHRGGYCRAGRLKSRELFFCSIVHCSHVAVRRWGSERVTHATPNNSQLKARLSVEGRTDLLAPAYLKLLRFPARSPLPIATLPSMSLFPKLHSAFRLNPIYVARIPAAPFAVAIEPFY